MITIEEDIAQILAFVKHPAGFAITFADCMWLRPVSEDSPPSRWEVDWEECIDNMCCKFYKEFDKVEDAVTFFVEKRRYLCYGLDFEVLLKEENKDD